MPSTNATAHSAARFLQQLIAEVPFPIQSIQVDGGSEFRSVFERCCQEAELPLCVIPPKSPKCNSKVENFNGTLRQELLNFSPYLPDTISEMKTLLSDFCRDHNTIRPNLALRYRDRRRSPSSHLDGYCSPDPDDR